MARVRSSGGSGTRVSGDVSIFGDVARPVLFSQTGRDNVQRVLDALIAEARNEAAHGGSAQSRHTVLGQAIEAAAAAGDPSGLVALLDAYVMEAKSVRDQALAERERTRAEQAALSNARQKALLKPADLVHIGDTQGQGQINYRAHGSTPGDPLPQTPRRAKPRRAAPRRDMAELALRPDPLAARDAAGLLAALRAYRQWAGQPSFRDMAARCEYEAGASTMCKALKGEELPELWLVDAIVTGCGGSGEDRDSFAAAWRVIAAEIPGAPDIRTWLAGAGEGRATLRAVPQDPELAERAPLRPAAGEDGR